MNDQQKALCEEAAKSLKLHDIVLFESRFRRGGSETDKGKIQSKKEIRFTRIPMKIKDRQVSAVHVLVALGARVVEPGTEQENEPKEIFAIEADYLVAYEIIGELSDEALRAFAHFNSVHNAWPFWRQQVYDTVQKGRLPHLDVPLYSG